ncbi:hypothetical protein GQ55_1G289900 [Panicum hallii var. hallii]|uniref:Uncharacterized protein n=2 Tax=Panicum hallii TaxID=206008 RepID=A0A2T7F8P4_9POAL|nr:hypothetical protein GQ55_1G289900 [Panicum hallii var. hallii]PVH66604.1 hypothetical protein PAHAL_1G296200 [Panicum hallii]
MISASYQVFMFQFCAESLKGDTTCIGAKKLKFDQRISTVP